MAVNLASSFNISEFKKMASTAAERKAKQRQEMTDKGFVRKDFWLNEESIKIIESYKAEHNCTNDEAINQIIKGFK